METPQPTVTPTPLTVGQFLAYIRKQDACREARQWVEQFDPDRPAIGLLTEDGLEAAWVNWFINHLPDAITESPLYAEYRQKRAPLDAEYEQKRDTLYAEYRQKRAPLYAEYRQKRAPLYAEYVPQFLEQLTRIIEKVQL